MPETDKIAFLYLTSDAVTHLLSHTSITPLRGKCKKMDDMKSNKESRSMCFTVCCTNEFFTTKPLISNTKAMFVAIQNGWSCSAELYLKYFMPPGFIISLISKEIFYSTNNVIYLFLNLVFSPLAAGRCCIEALIGRCALW